MVRKGKNGALHLRQIKHFLETGTYLPSVQVTERNGIRKASKCFVIDGGFYYVGAEGNEKRLVLLTNDEKTKAFEECHQIKKSEEHYGRTKTLACLREKYYWTSMVQDTVAMIVDCKVCELNICNALGRYVRVTEPWEYVSIDILGQFTITNSGYAFVAVIIDIFTKYTLAFPLRDTTVSDIATAIEKSIYQQGAPRKFLTDQSEEFVRELNEVLEIDKGLPKIVIPITKQEMNRPDEAKIKSEILKHCQFPEQVWLNSLQKKVYNINSTFETLCGHVPYYLMFHRSPKSVEQLGMTGFYVKSSIVMGNVENYMKERSKVTKSLYHDVLSAYSTQEESAKSEHITKDRDAVMLKTDDFLQVRHQGDHGYQKIMEDMANVSSSKNDHSIYATVKEELKEESMQNSAEASVYEINDGEGQVIVMADGIRGGNESAETNGQQMVIVQTGLNNKGLVMLSNERFSQYDIDP